ncbi:MAG: anthranilate phosphoribosyltransferase [Pseudomonadota bacterium]|nr:anthranilate phosphoribosyltransferase [Pseudomonadota bacterium]MEC7831232.1 anthranilate phosphoribosyltransferase [Pseudomonadota bacterium]
MSKFEEILSIIKSPNYLSREDSEFAFNFILEGKASENQIESFLLSLVEKGETIDDIISGVNVLRNKSLKVEIPFNAIDTCGTGGDKSGTYNISTAATFVAAGAGCIIAKHGNKALSSKSGSSQVLEELGVKIDISPENIANCIKESNIGFMFAPNHHSAMKYVGPVRQKLNVRTIFNILGPLVNPGNVKKQLIGVYDKKWLIPLTEVLSELGSERAMLVCGSDGLDEITTTGISYITELKDKKISSYEIDPKNFGIDISSSNDLVGGSPKDNATKILKLLRGEEGPFKDIVALNSAAAIYISGVADNIEEGLELANESLNNRKAEQSLFKLIEASNAK